MKDKILSNLKRLEKLAHSVHVACKDLSKDEFFYPKWELDLTGACAVASFALWEKSLLLGIDVDLIVGIHSKLPKDNNYPNHSWIIYDKYIIDPTYCQVNKSIPILINCILDTKGYSPVFFNTDATKDLLKWPKEQQPYFFNRIWKWNTLKLIPDEKLYD